MQLQQQSNMPALTASVEPSIASASLVDNARSYTAYATNSGGGNNLSPQTAKNTITSLIELSATAVSSKKIESGGKGRTNPNTSKARAEQLELFYHLQSLFPSLLGEVDPETLSSEKLTAISNSLSKEDMKVLSEQSSSTLNDLRRQAEDSSKGVGASKKTQFDHNAG
jgi:hypothetical protein